MTGVELAYKVKKFLEESEYSDVITSVCYDGEYVQVKTDQNYNKPYLDFFKEYVNEDLAEEMLVEMKHKRMLTIKRYSSEVRRLLASNFDKRDIMVDYREKSIAPF